MTQAELNLLFIFGVVALFALVVFLIDFIGRRQERRERTR
jgi:hypothetical protein